ncbi:transducer, TlpC [Cereibacter sphaeroides]|uniref:Transducer, TlpC n=1 Tax=Cereibacter sphaeroides TaxID=1063 RepID=A0AAX1UFR1_CERSP|nr:transducer, TlpC [Cereibacter sphaeroides]RHZ91349.1 transducer, TlpC [Cereibacter sphaeroides]
MKLEPDLPEAIRMAQPAHPLDFVLLSTEQTFLRAGETLAQAVRHLNDLRVDFGRLDAALGPGQAQRFLSLTAETGTQASCLAGEFVQFEEASRALRTAVGAMRAEVTDLMATIRAISIVKLQARIIGNMLTGSRQRVEAFTGGLTRMAAEAADLVAEVDEAMNEIAAETAAMDDEAAHLSQTLRELVLPNLTAIGAAAAEVSLDRQRMAEGHEALARRMEAIFGAVSHLILALQAGDSARQRFEHVRHLTSDALAAAAGETGLEAVLLDLGVAQTAATVRGLTVHLGAAQDTFLEVQGSASAAIGLASGLYLGDASRGSGAIQTMMGRAQTVETGLTRCGAHLHRLAGHAARVAAHLEKIRHHEGRMRRIEDQVRLFGLNAVIVCAKLGQEGRALQEISRQLRDLTQISAEVFTRLHGRLERTQERAAAIGSEAVAGLEREMGRVADGAQAVRALLEEAEAAHAAAGNAFGKAGRILTSSLETAAGLMGNYRRNLVSLQAFEEQLVRRRAVVSGPLDLTPAAEGLLAAVRKSYTVPEEREIHDAIVRAALPSHTEEEAAPPRVEAGPGAGSEEDLADIFF